jgi:aquaporin Z
MLNRKYRKYWAEAFGSFWLVFGGCAAALYTSSVPQVGGGYLVIALAFGLTVLTGAYAFARISGAHFNPAITVGMAVNGRIPAREVVPYVVSQLIGGILAGLVLYWIATGRAGNVLAGGFASTGYGEHSLGKFSMVACFVTEVVMTFFFVTVILAVTARKATADLAPLAIGLTLVLIHLGAIHVSGASVNPMRSTSTALIPAIFGGPMWPIQELWLYWIAPLLGGGLAGWVYKEVFADD